MRADPLYRLSEHFILADFLGNHTVYSRGHRNMLEGPRAEVDAKLRNASALCETLLEPLLEKFGPLSISYGYISPELSRRIVTYQDPDKPSHHRFDLGAAADVCVHNWVRGSVIENDLPDSIRTAPVALAHYIDQFIGNYSRLITYSESPYLCLAASAAELEQGKPRLMMYENRYTGRPKVKPEWRTYGSSAVRRREWAQLKELGLDHPWEGAGHPTYHGGGLNQYQHRRVSDYTMLSDWLFDLQSIANGWKNIPAINLDSVQDAIGAAGIVYDSLIDELTEVRFSIIGGYVSHLSSAFDPKNDWRTGRISFTLVPSDPEHLHWMAQVVARFGGQLHEGENGTAIITVEVDAVYAYVNARANAV